MKEPIPLTSVLADSPDGVKQRELARKLRSEMADLVTRYSKEHLDPEFIGLLFLQAALHIHSAYSLAIVESKNPGTLDSLGGFAE